MRLCRQACAFSSIRLKSIPSGGALARAGEPVVISDRQLDVLLLLVGRAGQIVSKDDLLQAGWKDVAVGDNSLEQAISSLRRTLGSHPVGRSLHRNRRAPRLPVHRGRRAEDDQGNRHRARRDPRALSGLYRRARGARNARTRPT